MKKLLCMILTFILLTGMCMNVCAEYMDVTIHQNNNGIIWSVTTNGLIYREDGDHIIVTGYNLSLSRVLKLYVPATYNNKAVVLAEQAFVGIPVRELIFEEGIFSIPDGLCRDSIVLQKVTIPKSVREIGDRAFKDCTSLIDAGTVYAETIGVEAFSGCINMTIDVKNARYIGSRAFEGCTKVTGASNSFDGEVEFVDGKATLNGITYVLENKEVWISECDKNIEGEIILPEKIAGYPVTKIVYPGFYDCSKLTKVVLPDSMKSIGTWAFWGCDSLSEVILNSGLEAIGQEAFEYCGQLKEITIPNSVKRIEDMAFRGSGLENIRIGSSVTYIGDGAFWDCKKLESITIPDSVTTLGTNESLYPSGYFGGVRADKKLSPFYGCENLRTITIGKGVEQIYPDTFYNCEMLQNVNISEENPSYTSLDGAVYSKDMTTLVCMPKGKHYAMLTIPEGVCEIAEKALCSSIVKTLYIPQSVTNIHGDNVIPEKTVRYNSIDEIPEEAKSMYPVAGVYNGISWETDNGVLTLNGEGVLLTTISGEYTPVPWNTEEVKEVVIGEGIVGISGVFKNHTSLQKITLPESLTHIYDLSFYNCKSLESIIIPSSVTEIGVMAFGECYNLKDVKVMSKGEVKIYHGAFDIADGAVVYLPDSVKWMDRFAFTHVYSTGGNQLGANSRPQDVTVVANENSYVEEWAMTNGVKFRTPPGVRISGKFLIDGNVHEENGVIYVSGEAAFEALGISIDCDDERKIAVCGTGNEWMIFNEGAVNITTSSGVITVTTPVKWINGMFMVPQDVLVQLGYGEVKIVQAGDIKKADSDKINTALGGVIPIALKDITVSQVPESENGAFNMIDGLITTRWAAEVTDKNEPCWAIFDLGEVCELEKIGLSFYRDLIRTTEFALEVSVDGVEYKEAIARRNSPGKSEEVEYYDLDGIQARYVKLLGYGNSSPYSNIKNWFSPTEVEIYRVGDGPVVTPHKEEKKIEIGTDGKVNLKDASVTASIISEPQNGADKLYDGNLSTYCVLYIQDEAAPQFVQIDLGKVMDVEKIALAIRFPKQRTTYFDIRVSEDGENYTTVVPKRGSDSGANPYEYFGIHQNARYIRIYGYSNTYNKYWASFTELEVYVNN